jgi:hypothetical protein
MSTGCLVPLKQRLLHLLVGETTYPSLTLLSFRHVPSGLLEAGITLLPSGFDMIVPWDGMVISRSFFVWIFSFFIFSFSSLTLSPLKFSLLLSLYLPPSPPPAFEFQKNRVHFVLTHTHRDTHKKLTQ